MFESFEMAPRAKAIFNVGCLLDIPTGHYVKGKHGESILLAGLYPLTGIGARANMFKSTLMDFYLLSTLDRYPSAMAQTYDTECTKTMYRMESMAWQFPNLAGKDLEDERRAFITNKGQYQGDEWYNMLKKAMESKLADPKHNTRTCELVDKRGEYTKVFMPSLVGLDSISEFSSSMEEKYSDEDIGSKERNMQYMAGGRVKTQLLGEAPALTSKSSLYMILCAHMGDEFQLDAYAPNPKKLAFMSNNLKFKGVSEKFTFLPHNTWWIYSLQKMLTKDKTPEFPIDTKDEFKGDTDLLRITMTALRAKGGASGMPIELVVSQSQGILRGLTEFCFLKTMDKYGITGNDRTYQIALVPEVNLGRTTIRSKINETPKLQRALEICSEMCQMHYLWNHLDDGFICSPEELYNDLKAKGYDWDVLLSTRGYWMFLEDIKPDTKPFLSTMDLLNMRAGTYHPYWLPKPN